MFSLDQYRAAHTAAVMVDASAQGTIALTGADRAAFLHGLLTNDVASLTPGRGTYAAYLTPQGRMISDMRVIETGSRMLLAVSRHVAAELAGRLDRLVFSEDVHVHDVTDELDVIGVHGPSASAMIQRATGVSVADLTRQYDNVSVDSMTIVRDDAVGVQGFDVYAPGHDADVWRQRLHSAGAVAASGETHETLRIEAGRPRFGVDMNTDTIPLEAGIEDRAISFTKGCYVGQEVIVRVMHRGHGRVARRLVLVVMPSGKVPAPGDGIFAGDRQVGAITSAAESPKLGSALAFGYVQRDHAAAATDLRVNGLEARVYQAVD
jgi:folate-binding protein YgfZ